jgi:hypothetical protein
LKYRFVIFFLLVCINLLQSQTDSSRKDTVTPVTQKPIVMPKPIVVKPADTTIATSTDSLPIIDSVQLAYQDSLQKDSLAKVVALQKPVQKLIDTSTYASIMYHPYIPYNTTKLFKVTQYRNSNQNNYLFYALLGLVVIIAFIRVSFPKYFQSLFQLFAQTSFRQKQTKEQLSQDNLASLLMNFLFVLSIGMFITLVASKYNWVSIDFWWLYMYCCSLLAAIYLVKYLFLLFSGWVFNVEPATNTYLFVVFLVNKVLGVISIPFILIVAFSAPKIVTVALTIITIVIILLLIYRYVASLGTIRRSLKVNALHFFLYLCAVEVLPLLLMYKAFFNFIKD